MQNQEHMYSRPEPTPPIENQVNSDPREQARSQDSTYTAYTEGYRGHEMRNTWDEGQKLQPVPQSKQKNMGKLLAIIVLLCIAVICIAFIAGGHYGVILGWLSWIVVAVLTMIIASALIAHQHVVAIPMPTRTFQINEHARLMLNNSAGNVVIRRGEEGVISVTATKRASGIGINPEHIQVYYEQYGDAVNITTNITWNVFLFNLRSVEFEITVPASCDIQTGNGWGNFQIQSVQGDIRLGTGSGNIEVRDLQGQIAMKTGNGSIKANYIHGQIIARTGNGSIEASFLEGNTELKTGNGNISVTQSTLVGASHLVTGNGNLTFSGTLDPDGRNEMKTGNGSIHLQLPSNATFSLDAKTGSGSVHNEFGSNEVGSGSRTQLKLRTGNGGIHIMRGGMYERS